MNKNIQLDRVLKELHDWFLRSNYHDEGDLLYFRINHRLADAFGITKEQAEEYHSRYHINIPRLISKGYCERCDRIVTIIPIIYGIQESDMKKMNIAESEGRIIIGNVSPTEQQSKTAMFGCKICKSPLPRYGSV
jgi:hypothetical protein